MSTSLTVNFLHQKMVFVNKNYAQKNMMLHCQLAEMKGTYRKKAGA
jgi:hypothetical protein